MKRSLHSEIIMIAMLAVWWTGMTPAPAAERAPAGQSGQSGAADKSPHALIKTKFGDMEIKFFPEKAPKHVENFLKLAKEGKYNGTIFHRVIPGFMIQGGDPNTKDTTKKELYGMGGPGYSVKGEFNDTPHKRGIVSMARSQDPDSAGSQFFICVNDANFLDWQYTVFGEVRSGLDVVDRVVNVKRDGRDNPLERVEMTVTVSE